MGSGVSYKKVSVDAAYVFRWANNVDGENLITTGNTQVDVRQHTVLVSLIAHF